MLALAILLVLSLAGPLLTTVSGRAFRFPVTDADMAAVLKEVGTYQDDADAIIKRALYGDFKGVTWNRLANFTDLSGNRQCGSQQYEDAVDMAIDLLTAEGFDKVYREPMDAPQWQRNTEHLTLLNPRKHPYKMNMLGLGSSIGTGPDGLTADVIVVRSVDDLAVKNASGLVAGKIVLYNWYCDWANRGSACYSPGSSLRGSGGVTAAQYGAVGALIRSVTGFSMNSPHTGSSQTATIPWAAITTEDSDMLQRLQDRGLPISVHLYMNATGNTLPSTINHNVIAEITGSTYPNEVVLVSGHFDSWDVGNGVMDDADGAWISWSALSLVKMMGWKPKRTMRLVLWACEETGGLGGRRYYYDHNSTRGDMQIVMESDEGVFAPYGFEFTGNQNATAVIQSIGVLLRSIDASAVRGNGGGLDIQPWINNGVPGASIWTNNAVYFNYHHTNADNMAVVNSDDLDRATALWTVYAWVLADMESMLSRDPRSAEPMVSSE